MSRFLSPKYCGLEPYAPGEQPYSMKDYIKLNTNESPFPPSEKSVEYAKANTRPLNLYSDPELAELTKKIALYYKTDPSTVLVSNGSDKVLNFAFMAFTDDKTPAVFADITYGFYPVFACLNGSAVDIVPLREDFSLNIDDYIGRNGTVFIANPNAPTGLAVSVGEIERLIVSNPYRVVVVDEAYVDFGAKSCIRLVKKYDNLLVCQTFSKSRSFAGGRLGYAIGAKSLIDDLKAIKYSTNPYNVNSMTSAMGIGILNDMPYYTENCRKIMENRAFAVKELKALGFTVLDSKANFIFVSSDRIEGEAYYRELKEKGILVRHFNKDRISNWCRVSIGTKESIEVLISKTKEILGGTV